MPKHIIAIATLLAVAACSEVSTLPQVKASGGTMWDKIAYVNALTKPQWGVMKALEQPGIY